MHVLAMELLHYAISHEDDVWVKALPSKVGNWLDRTSSDKAFLRRCHGVEALLAQQEKEQKVAEEALLAAVQAAPEFESCRRVSERAGVAIKGVYEAALLAWRQRPGA